MSALRPLLIAAPLVLCSTAGSAEEKNFAINIPAQSLPAALESLAQQTGIKPFLLNELAKGKSSHAVKGQYSAQQALTKLLEGTGLSYSFSSDDSVIIKAADNQSNNATLPPVKVVGSAVYDVKDPYNEDYVLPIATAGTKTDTPIMETPLNVQVISKQVMKDQQVITLQDSLKNVSGVVINPSTDNPDTGIGSTITLRGFESNTTLRNGLRLQNGGLNRNMSNVESVEVLKGPAAILYGLVEPGGMVNVVTKQPQATPYYAFNQQFGSYDFYRTTLDATGPLTKDDTLLYRMNVAYQNSGSYQDYVGEDDVFLAPVLKWNISSKTQVSAEFEYNRQHQGLADSFNPYVNGQLFKIPLNRNYGDYSPAVTETFFGNLNWSHQFNEDWAIKHGFSVNQRSFNANKVAQGVLTMAQETRDVFWGPQSQPFSGLGVIRGGNKVVTQSNTYSTNLDLTGHFDTFGLQHTLLLGGDYYRLNNDSATVENRNASLWSVVDPFNPVNPGLPLNRNVNGSLSNQQQIDQYGLYAQDQIKLPYDVHVTGGLRYQNIHQNTLSTGANAGPLAIQSQDAVTPRVGILWHPQSWISLYANYAESFGANSGFVWSGPGQNPGDPGQVKAIAPTSATQYEGGIKTEFFDGRLRATLAYYDLTKINVAASDPNQAHNCGGGGGDCSLAIGAVRSRGPELDIQGEILPGWNAIASWANTDVIVTKTNAHSDNLNTGNYGYAVGDRIFNVPRNTASFWSTYELLDTDFIGLKFGGGVTVREGQIGSGGNTFAGDAHYPVIKVPGYATLDLMTAYSRAVGKSKVTVQFNVTNLLDKRYFTNINAGFNDPAIFGDQATFGQLFSAYAPYGAPRTFMGSINIQY